MDRKVCTTRQLKYRSAHSYLNLELQNERETQMHTEIQMQTCSVLFV